MARGKKHSNKPTLKEAGPEKIWTLYNQRGNQTESIQARASRRMGYNVFNEDLLTHCKKAEFASQHKDPALLPDIINEEEEYEVEEIRGHYKKGRGTQFFIH